MKEKAERQYTYDAFISYRHAEPDKLVAETLHRYLEAFKPPKSILKSGKASRTRIERVFRDKDELPLTSNLEDPLVNALMQSEYLIVICSPRLKESVWCRKEIETFIAYHGRENVFAVLVEGEPEESFPDELLYVDEYFYYPDGTQGVNRRALEPLAADVRAPGGKKDMIKALKSEMLRLLAPMFGVTYDDLRQRHRERRLKKIAAVSTVTAALCLVVGVLSTAAALRIKRQKEQIQVQADEIEAQADEISAQNQKLMEEQAKSLADKSIAFLETGDRENAILTARQALSEYEGIKMPYTPEAKYALTESMHVYDSGNVSKARYQIMASGIINYMFVSPDGKTVVTNDSMGIPMIWDIGTGELLDTLPDVTEHYSNNSIVFVDADRLAYITKDSNINIYSISGKKIEGTIEAASLTGLFSNKQGQYLVVKNWQDYIVYDISTSKQLYTCTPQNGYSISEKCFFSNDNIMIYSETTTGEYEDATLTDAEPGIEESSKTEQDAAGGTRTKLHFINLEDGSELSSHVISYEAISDVRFKGQNVYMVANNFSMQASDMKAAVICYNVASGECLWEKSLDGFATDLCVSYAEESKELLVYSSLEMLLLDEKTGAETARFAAGSEIIKVVSYKSTPQFMLFTRSGMQGLVIPDLKECVWVEYAFDCKSPNVSKFEPCEGGFLVLPHNDRRITFYSVSKGPDLQPCDDKITPQNTNKESSEYYISEAKKLGLERAVLVTDILYSPDNSVIFVSYSDMTMEIYNLSDMRLLESISDMDCEMTEYLGADKEGSIYIAGASAGYCLDSDYNLTAKIENLLAVDKEKNRLIVGTKDNLYQLPIYTTEELLNMDLDKLF